MRNGYTDLCELVFYILLLLVLSFNLCLRCSPEIVNFFWMPFPILNSMFSLISFNFCNVCPRSCDVVANVSAILSLEFLSFTIDQKMLQSKARFIYRCSNFTMFRRNLYQKSGRKSYLYNVKRSSSMVEKS